MLQHSELFRLAAFQFHSPFSGCLSFCCFLFILVVRVILFFSALFRFVIIDDFLLSPKLYMYYAVFCTCKFVCVVWTGRGGGGNGGKKEVVCLPLVNYPSLISLVVSVDVKHHVFFSWLNRRAVEINFIYDDDNGGDDDDDE